jgi:hypothetical protein
MRLPTFLTALPAAAALTLAACSTAPPAVRLYTLMPAEPEAHAAPAGTTAIALSLDPLRVPPPVDQPQWLVRLADESLVVLEQERWVAPLGEELRQALMEALAARWGVVDARGLPPGGPPPVRVGLEIRRFDSLPGREARIEAAWTLASPAASLRCEALFREAAGAGMPALAAAHRRAVGRLADAIGASLRPTARGGAATCPGNPS